MKRREIVSGIVATIAASTLSPFLPGIAWSKDALASPHMPLIRDHIAKALRVGQIRVRGPYGSFFEEVLELNHPRFFVDGTERVWNMMTGHTDEIAPAITLYESGVEVGTVGIGSTAGASLENLPPYFVRAVWLDEKSPVRDALRSQLTFDFSWLQKAVPQLFPLPQRPG